jgi:polar amino acid transport system substrate-binding protein
MPNPTETTTIKIVRSLGATTWRLNLWVLTILLVVFSQTFEASAQSDAVFPGFRHVDPFHGEASQPQTTQVVLLADADFAPWSFVGEDGALQGISVEIARSACADAGLTCDIQAAAFAELLPKLKKGEAQAIITGLKRDAALASEFALTRPYFQSLARFAVRNGSPLSAPDIRTLAGRKLGYRANTTHARFLEKFYNRSALTPFETQDQMQEALRTGLVDAIFSDAVLLSYWLGGSASKGCCTFLGKAFLHRDSFSRGLGFVVRRDDPALRQRFDDALDRLESKGDVAKIFARYLPASVW